MQLEETDMYSYIDMHCDTLWSYMDAGYEQLYENQGMQSIKLMQEASQLCQFFAVFFPAKNTEVVDMYTPKKPMPADEVYFEKLRKNLLQVVEAHPELIAMAYSANDIVENQKKGRMSAVLTMEDGRMIQGSMKNLQKVYEAGVRVIGLTWNHANCFGYPNAIDAAKMSLGLTDFGKEAVEEMNCLGILTDVSHLSDGGFWDVINISKKPIIASHSNCRAISPHPRNLTDDMIRAVAEKGGVIGVNLYAPFVRPDMQNARYEIDALVLHVKHLMQIGGEDCVGIGSDFDGMDGDLLIDNPVKMQLLWDALEQEGLSHRQIQKIAQGNVLRVLQDTI